MLPSYKTITVVINSYLNEDVKTGIVMPLRVGEEETSLEIA